MRTSEQAGSNSMPAWNAKRGKAGEACAAALRATWRAREALTPHHLLQQVLHKDGEVLRVLRHVFLLGGHSSCALLALQTQAPGSLQG